jgi:hypothetical protein
MPREIRRENFSLLQQRRWTVGASTQCENVRIGSLLLIVNQDSEVYLQASFERQLDIRPEAHGDHNEISRRYFTVRESHGFHAPVAKYGLDLGHPDVASALSEAAAGFRRQPTANHHGRCPF